MLFSSTLSLAFSEGEVVNSDEHFSDPKIGDVEVQKITALIKNNEEVLGETEDQKNASLAWLAGLQEGLSGNDVYNEALTLPQVTEKNGRLMSKEARATGLKKLYEIREEYPVIFHGYF